MASTVNSAAAAAAAAFLADQITDRTFALAPFVGDYKLSAFQADNKGWLKCDGRLLQAADYPTLFHVLGDAFGASGAGTFRLPNCRGRVPGAIGASVGATHVMGDVVGAETHTLTVPEMPSHTHSGTTDSAGTHNHGGTTNTTGSHNHGGATGASAPSSGAQGIAALGGGNDVAEDNGSHSHGISTDGAHSHSISTDGAHTHTFTTGSTGGNNAHNIMQPTIYLGDVFIFAGDNRLLPLRTEVF